MLYCFNSSSLLRRFKNNNNGNNNNYDDELFYSEFGPNYSIHHYEKLISGSEILVVLMLRMKYN